MKKTNYHTGLAAEALCRFALRLKSYRIVASRYRSKLGEIDIIAKRGRCIALDEVKAWATQYAAAEALNDSQCARLEDAADNFLARHPHFNMHDLRFDLMLVAPLASAYY